MQLIIRKATKFDVPKIEKMDSFGDEILSHCSPLDKLDPNRKPTKGRKNYYEQFILGRNKWCYVAENNNQHSNQLIGFILFNIEQRPKYWNIKKIGYIDLIVISKKVRGRGISRLLFQKAYDIFKTKKIEYVKLSVQTDNLIAHNIWKKFGYKEFRVDMYKKI